MNAQFKIVYLSMTSAGSSRRSAEDVLNIVYVGLYYEIALTVSKDYVISHLPLVVCMKLKRLLSEIC